MVLRMHPSSIQLIYVFLCQYHVVLLLWLCNMTWNRRYHGDTSCLIFTLIGFVLIIQGLMVFFQMSPKIFFSFLLFCEKLSCNFDGGMRISL